MEHTELYSAIDMVDYLLKEHGNPRQYYAELEEIKRLLISGQRDLDDLKDRVNKAQRGE